MNPRQEADNGSKFFLLLPIPTFNMCFNLYSGQTLSTIFNILRFLTPEKELWEEVSLGNVINFWKLWIHMLENIFNHFCKKNLFFHLLKIHT